MNLREKLLYRLQCMKDRRESFEDHARDLADHYMPRSYRWLDESWSKRGNKANKKIIDATGTLALRAMVAAFSSGITPTSRPWKKLTIRGELAKNHGVRSYLEEASELMDASILGSNFYPEASKLYEQCGLFATAAMLIEEDEESDIRCETLPFGSYWLGIDSKRRVCEFAREIPMTIKQMADAFGMKRLSERHRASLASGKPSDETINVLHWIGKDDCYCEGTSLGRMKYESIYLDPTDNEPDAYLRRGGYDEFPVVTPRWKAMGDDVYGLDCPGMMALGSVKQLQHAQKQIAKAAEKMVSPPTLTQEGAARKGVDATAGGNTVVSKSQTGEGVRALYQINFDLGGATMIVQDLRTQIRESFFYNLFLMVAGERRSGTKAREIDELHEEKMLMLSTVYEQFSEEFLNPAVERIYNILNRRGRLPVPPPEMQGQPFEIEYVSVMAQAMKMVGIGNMDRALALLGQVASIDPTVLDISNNDAFVTQYWDRLGVDVRVRATPEEIEQKRAARQQQADEAKQMQTAQVQADTAKVLSDAKLDEDNALTQIIGNTIG